MLQRIYGALFETQAELDDYLRRLEEAQQRDHRRLGRELELFMSSSLVGAGLPLWLPKGATIRRVLEEWITKEERDAGYRARLHAGHRQERAVREVGPLGALQGADVPADEARARGDGAAADELPAPHPHLPVEDAQLPRPAGANRGAGHDVPLREVGRDGRADARPRHDAERRPHLLPAGPDRRASSRAWSG